MKAQVDQDGCIGCGLCTTICPSVFQMTNDGVAEATGVVTDDLTALAQEAEQSCPVSVIHIY